MLPIALKSLSFLTPQKCGPAFRYHWGRYTLSHLSPVRIPWSLLCQHPSHLTSTISQRHIPNHFRSFHRFAKLLDYPGLKQTRCKIRKIIGVSSLREAHQRFLIPLLSSRYSYRPFHILRGIMRIAFHNYRLIPSTGEKACLKLWLIICSFLHC